TIVSWRPPSEKESGVTFTTPMTSGRSSDSVNLPQTRRRTGLGRFIGASTLRKAQKRSTRPSGCARTRAIRALPRPPRSGSRRLGGRRRRRHRRAGAGPGAGSAAARRALLGRPGRAARHDVVDLVGVDRFPLEQRLGHRLDLVPVLLEDLARGRVLLVDDAADLAVDLA